MKKFLIKYTQNDSYFCLDSVSGGFLERNWEKINKEFHKHTLNFPQTYNVDKKDCENIIVVSSELKPLTFIIDGDYIRCSETKKYVCSFSHNRSCCGGAPLFLSHNEKCAIQFDRDNIDLNLNDPNKELVLWFNKSLVYPRPGYPGKGAIVPGGGRLSECRPMIAYHGPDVPQRWKIEKKHMMVFQSI